MQLEPSQLRISPMPKTWILDLDGTLVVHDGPYFLGKDEFMPGAREVMEETGVQVKNIRYYKSQPWGMAQDILVGFFCDADGDGAITMDESELKYAEWVKREDIVLQPNNLSLTNEMMKVFKEGK